MVQGTSSKQNASEKVAPRYDARAMRYRISSRLPLRFTRVGGPSSATTNAKPRPSANKPLSGRNNTAHAARIPVKHHKIIARLEPLDFIASVAVTHIATAKNIVGTSVSIVAT